MTLRGSCDSTLLGPPARSGSAECNAIDDAGSCDAARGLYCIPAPATAPAHCCSRVIYGVGPKQYPRTFVGHSHLSLLPLWRGICRCRQMPRVVHRTAIRVSPTPQAFPVIPRYGGADSRAPRASPRAYKAPDAGLAAPSGGCGFDVALVGDALGQLRPALAEKPLRHVGVADSAHRFRRARGGEEAAADRLSFQQPSHGNERALSACPAGAFWRADAVAAH